MKLTILLCDDDQPRVDEWMHRLQQVKSVAREFETKTLLKREFLDAVKGLEERRRKSRQGAGGDLSGNPFDDADVLVVDYDLLDLATDNELFPTGEAIAYLARCYSGCGAIVGLNQFGDRTFDLSLKGHPESYADLNVGSEHFALPGLWEEPWTGFRPWSWPLLPRLVSQLNVRSEALLQGKLGEPICQYLGFAASVVAAMPRSVLAFIAGDGEAEGASFRAFALESGNGYRGKDQPPNDHAIARVAAARIGKWLERVVLSGQDIVVDAPHLVARFPSLLGDQRTIDEWNRVALFNHGSEFLGESAALSPHRFNATDWLSRRAWWWRGVSESDLIPEVVSPWDRSKPDLVFCEDLSAFVPESAARPFVADLSSPFARRFVARSDASHNAMYRAELDRVEYRPSVRFALSK